MARVPGRDRDKPALVLHGHLDVVPAIAEDWSVDPFAGEIRDGMLWGRGAVDMKDMDAMILTSVADILRSGEQPERDLVLAFFADEENGGVEGSALVVQNKPEWFDGRDRGDQRGRRLLDRRRRSPRVPPAGRREGARLDPARRARARRARLELPRRQRRDASSRPPSPRSGAPSGRVTPHRHDPRDGRAARATSPASRHDDPDALAAATGAASGFLRATLRTTTNPTGLTAGYKHNVIPDRAEALIDVRALPGTEEAALADIRRIVGDDVEVEIVHQDIGLEVPFAGRSRRRDGRGARAGTTPAFR